MRLQMIELTMDALPSEEGIDSSSTIHVTSMSAEAKPAIKT
jgi:hypothetical protein